MLTKTYSHAKCLNRSRPTVKMLGNKGIRLTATNGMTSFQMEQRRVPRRWLKNREVAFCIPMTVFSKQLQQADPIPNQTRRLPPRSFYETCWIHLPSGSSCTTLPGKFWPITGSSKKLPATLPRKSTASIPGSKNSTPIRPTGKLY